MDIASRQNDEILLEVTVDYVCRALKSILSEPSAELLLVRSDNMPVLRFLAMVRAADGSLRAQWRWPHNLCCVWRWRPPQARAGEPPRIVQDVPALVLNQPEQLEMVSRLSLPSPSVSPF